MRILLDAGLACREMERRLRTLGVSARDIDGVLLSHEHSDHSKGAWRFCAKHEVPLYATDGTFREIHKLEDRHVDWVRVRSRESVKIGRLTIDLFRTPHDASDPVGFRVHRGKLAFGHVTDIGHMSDDVIDGLRGCSAILIEANHDVDMLRESDYPASIRNRVGSRFGHLSNDALAHYLEQRLPDGVRHILLAHLSQQNNHEQLALECCTRGARAARAAARPSCTSPIRIGRRRCSGSRSRRLVYDDQKQGLLVFT